MAISNRRQLTHTLQTALLATAACLLAACGGGSSSDDAGSGQPTGALVLNPATNLFFVVESSESGQATSLRFSADPVWGRLVDIVATDPQTGGERTYFRDFLIGEDIVSGPDYDLDRNPATGREVLTILHAFQSPAFDSAFARLDDGLQRFLDKGLGAGVLPPFTSMPRNAAMAIKFNDLLDPDSVSSATVLIETGYPPSIPFQARILPDPNHGDFRGTKFYSTRVLIDMSVSEAEAPAAGVDPNPLGMPEATELNQPNMVVRIPTIQNAQATQFDLLTNISGHALSFGGNGSTLSTSPTLDVIRAFRSGGSASVTGDAFNGFLRDLDPPQVLGSQSVQITFVAPVGTDYAFDLIFQTPVCALTPRVGDLVVLPGDVVVEVIQAGNPPSASGAVSNVLVQLLAGSPASVQPSVGEYRAPFDAGVGVPSACFLGFSPDPLTGPATGVSSDASIVIGFDEPMLPRSLSAFDGFVVRKAGGSGSTFDLNVMAVVIPGRDLQDYSFDPLVELDHVAGSSEAYTVQLTTTVTDLAGNPLAFPLPTSTFTLNPAGATKRSGSLAFTFSGNASASSAAVDDNGDGFPEFRGQFIHDVLRGEIRPRPVDRFSGVIDESRCSVSAMLIPGVPTLTSGGAIIIVPIGALEPLSPHGSRTMTSWRYYDMGLSLLDETTYNIDVEGLAWAPFTQGLALDFFSQFEIALAHSAFMPDSSYDPVILMRALVPASGLSSVFASNQLDPANDPLKVVHHRNEGYLVQPLDQFQSPSGALLAPWPLNQRKPQSKFQYYTYRDTSITAVGGVGSLGVDPPYLGYDPNALTSGATLAGEFLGCPESLVVQEGTFDAASMVYTFEADDVPMWTQPKSPTYSTSAIPPELVPTIGLPLLMDFRTFPDSSAQGINLLTWRLGTPYGIPTMRLHSTGAQLPNGNIISVNPDQQISATGGFDITGAPTPPTDDGFYLGQVDFVIRVSQIHSIWLDASAPSTWSAPVLIPSVAEQAPGTSVTLAYRGATSINPSDPEVALRAELYDPYGNVTNAQGPGGVGSVGVNFLNNDPSWKSNLNQLDGARLIQVRITMISNVESGVTPYLTAMGFSFSN